MSQHTGSWFQTHWIAAATVTALTSLGALTIALAIPTLPEPTLSEPSPLNDVLFPENLTADQLDESVDWNQALDACEEYWLQSRELFHIWESRQETNLTDFPPPTPKQDWPIRTQVESIVDSYQGVLQFIDDTAPTIRPVWEPIQVVEYAPHKITFTSQRPDNLIHVVACQLELSMNDEDHETALKSIGRMQTILDAFDDSPAYVGYPTLLQNFTDRYVGRSLNAGFWTLSDLDRLDKLTAPPANWPGVWEKQLAVHRWLAQEGPQEFRADIKTLEQLGSGSAEQILGNAYQFLARQEKNFTSPTIRTVEIMTSTLRHAMQQNKLTRTALAIKRFQLAHGHWPEQLEQLTEVGLTPDDWTVYQWGELGYETFSDHVELFVYEPGTVNWYSNPYSQPAPADRPNAPPIPMQRVPGFEYQVISIR